MSLLFIALYLEQLEYKKGGSNSRLECDLSCQEEAVLVVHGKQLSSVSNEGIECRSTIASVPVTPLKLG